ncbi:GtrA family protein [Candidatus Parcubacteria bacterium]|nr:MAG: GtrA family protein [Candidatus Parcubacteria bacterium]
MPRIKKTDLLLALAIGFFAASMMIFVGRNLSVENPAIKIILPYAWYLLIVFPLFCAGGLYLTKLASEFVGKFIFQFGKFALVGGFNFLLDAAILNFFIFSTGIASGYIQSSFKGISFMLGIVSSYLWNKYWTFSGNHGGSRKTEVGKYILISLIGFSLNVGIDYVLVNWVESFWMMKPMLWAQFSAVLAAVIGMFWNFYGYKFLVFKHASDTTESTTKENLDLL